MKEKLTCIVLSVIRHSDRADIVTLYSREKGRVSLVSRVGSSKAARMRRSMLTPPAILNVEADFDASQSLGRLGIVSPVYTFRDLRLNPIKSCISIFISEFLGKLLRDTPPDFALFDFVLQSLIDIENIRSSESANSHIALLIGLLSYCGIAPDLSGMGTNSWFDMREGHFSVLAPAHTDIIPPHESEYIGIFMRMTPRNSGKFKMNGKTRRHILELLLRYYAIHLPGTGNLRSKDVLFTIFS